jgi:hypothetical protein
MRKIDPTKNVIALNKASHKRQDDLRRAHEKYVNIRFGYIEEMAILRSEHRQQMADKESDRLNSIRQVDILNAQAAASQVLTAIQTLATATAANNARVDERISAVQRTQYESAGKGSGLNAMWGYAIAGIMVVINIWLLFKH